MEAELVELLDEHVDDPEAVAAASYDEFMERVGGGSTPLLIASFREEMDDGSLLSASLSVTRNEVTGDLDAWSDAYADADRAHRGRRAGAADVRPGQRSR